MVSDSPSATRTQQPVASPDARWSTIVIGLLFLGAAFVTGRELWVRHVNNDMTSWVKPITDTIGNLSWQNWMLYGGIVALLWAILLFVVALRPRPVTHRKFLSADAHVWMRPVDIARMITASTEKVAGVMKAHTAVDKHTVKVTITGNPNDPSLIDRVGRSVGPLVDRIDGKPTFKVSVITPEEDDR